MVKRINTIGVILFFILVLFPSSFAQETITVTTYYPSPYGSYNQLSTTGSTYLATSAGTNYVGIGMTSAATTALDVNGLIRVRNPQGETTAPTRSNNGEFAFACVGGVYRLYFRSNGSNQYITTSGGGDFSEFFLKQDKDAVLEPGDVVAYFKSNSPAGGVGLSKIGDGSKIIGVVSAQGTQNNNTEDGTRHLDPNYANIGILGHLKVKVCLEGGAINPGDYLTSSSKKGFAKRATESGEVMGIALESYDGKDKEVTMIMSYVNPQYWVNPNDFKNLSDKIKELENKLKELKTRG